MTDFLPPAPWTKREDLASLIVALGEGKARYVGGAVRDTLLGKTIHDVDCATVLMPHAVIDRCGKAGIKTVPTGIDHGTVTAVLPQGNVEITTLRRDVSTDGRRATVTFAAEWHEDAARRDFTMNALYADPQTLEITDFFGGLDDLSARRVRFIGTAAERIREDHLRILRYFRFQARFGDAPDPEAIDACRDLAHTLKGLSRERVAMEIFAILTLPHPLDAIYLMQRTDVLPVILPETTKHELQQFERLLVSEEDNAINADPVRRLGALLPAMPSVAEDVAARLRLSKKHRARLVCMAAREPQDAQSPRQVAYSEGLECARDRLLIAGADIAELEGWEVPRFPLKGREIVARGVAAGPEVARIMQAIERHWMAEGFPDGNRVNALLLAELGRRGT